MDLVSIIIPVYNAEKYLNKCLDSVINQTYSNIEIILVDDGSTDSSGEICDKYASIDNRIKVFHKANEGVSIARNYGIKISNGKYLCFVDSDDEISCDYVKMLHGNCLDNDVVICNIIDVYNGEDKIRNINGVLTGKFYEDYHILIDVLRVPFVKLYKKSIIDAYDIRFPSNLVVGEDQVFNFYYFEHVISYKLVNIGLYRYYHRGSGASCRLDQNAIDSAFQKLKIERLFLERNKIKNKEKIFNNHTINCINRYITKDDSFYDYKERVKMFRSLIVDFDDIKSFKRYIILNLLRFNLILPIYIYNRIKGLIL